MNYEKNPAEIYRKSFELVRSTSDLSGMEPGNAEIAIRVVHACGMPEIAGQLVFSKDCAASGRAAIKAGATILCDSRMVASGILRKRLPAGNRVVAAIDAPGAAEMAARHGTTRTAAAFDILESELGGSVVAIGNAPTALFRLLELIDSGAPKPALVVAMPVGFVGAAESKDELVRNPRGIPFATLPGRRGGSAMAAAAVNAICGEAKSHGEPEDARSPRMKSRISL